MLAVFTLAAPRAVRGDVPVVTILADFEDDSVAASLGDLENITPLECAVRRHSVPARGQYCLAMDIGATVANVSVACDLRLREPQRFWQADRIAVFYWLKEGEFQLAFRIRDHRGQIFETPPQPLKTRNRWVRITAELNADKLRRISGDGPLVWPIEAHGCRVVSGQLGKQSIYLDDFQVEHRVQSREMVRGEFVFDQPTRVYEPGSTIGAQINLENRSRETALRVSLELAWTRPDGSVLKTERATVTLPASGHDFRSRQPVDFSQRLDYPGLYHLVARASSSAWMTPSVFQTSVAVTPSNRLLPRGRSTFFGVRTDLRRESAADQQLEIAIARDIGVEVLAIDTPWRVLEPAAGRFDFDQLDRTIDALVRKDIDIAPLIVLTDPPAWLPSGPERLARLTTVFEQLARRYGAKVLHYQPDEHALPESDMGALAAALEQLQTRLRAIHEHIRVLSPPVDIDANTAARGLPDLTTLGDVAWCFRTVGDSAAAIEALDAVRRQAGGGWGRSCWWLHEAAPLVENTYFVDAEAVLRHYVHAALMGLDGVLWYDLRDNDNDVTRPEEMRGLVRRDFSPKASLLGYGSAAGMLTGLTCRGPVLGTPAGFESALFIGSDRQVAVLLPKPNRRHNAVFAPFWRVPGELEIRDFERRPSSPLRTTGGALVASSSRPLFITLKLENAQPEPQIALAEPWLRAPAVAFCGVGEPFTVQVDAPEDGGRGSVRLVLPPEAQFTATPTRQAIATEDKEALSASFQLAPKLGESFESGGMLLKAGIAGLAAEVPIEVRPIVEVQKQSSASLAFPGPTYELAQLSAEPGQRASADGTVYGTYDSGQLRLALAITDDRFVPFSVGADQVAAGDDLLIGLAAENGDGHVELRVDTSAASPALTPVYGTAARDLSAWKCRVMPGRADDERIWEVVVPASALGTTRLRPSARLLVAVRYVDDDADGLGVVPLMWGQGLDGRRTAEGFRWVRLADTGGD